MLADPLVYMVSSTKRVDRLIRATMSRFKHSSRCVAFANGISGILAATRPDQSCDETWKSHLQQRNASLKSYAHRRNLEQLKKELIDWSTVAHCLMVGSVYLSISEKFGFVCVPCLHRWSHCFQIHGSLELMWGCVVTCRSKSLRLHSQAHLSNSWWMFSFGNKERIFEVSVDSPDLEWMFPMLRTCHVQMLMLWTADCGKKLAWGNSSPEGLRMFVSTTCCREIRGPTRDFKLGIWFYERRLFHRKKPCLACVVPPCISN